MEPIGPVAGFSPWNFPVTQAVRKIAASLAAGCSIIIKCPEETPGSPIGLVKCFHDAGVPAGVINLVYGVPAEISEYLIPHPDHPQGVVHRLGAGRQASQRAGGQPHEARHHGARRPLAGAGVRRRRRGGRRQADGRLQVPQRRPGVRVAHPLLRARQGLRQLRRQVHRHRQARPRSATAWSPTRAWGRSPTRAASTPSRRSWPTRRRRAPRSQPAASASATRATSSSRPC